MIEKIWNMKNNERGYDAIFEDASQKLWNDWVEERNKEKYAKFDAVQWEKKFRCSPIVAEHPIDGQIWIGLRFKDEGEYMLFLLEWG